MFPAISSAVKGFLDRMNPAPLSLGLEQKNYGAGISFDAVTAGWYLRNGYPGIYSLIAGGLPAWSGEHVSLETALNHSVVWACNRIVSETKGIIPAVMLQSKGSGKRIAEEKPMYNALKNAPNDEITAQAFSELLTSHCLLQGNAFAQIIRRSGTGVAVELNVLLPQQVTPDREITGQKRLVYIVKEGNEQPKTYTVQKGKPHDILHIRGLGWDGVRGYSVIQMGRQSIGSAIAAERNVARFWANGGRVPYHLEMSKFFKNDQDFQKFRNDWEKTYGEPHKVPILENDIKYVRDGLSMVDAQALETRLFSIHEICRWFRVSPHLVGDLSRATFANIEQLALEFGKFTLATWLKKWEEELWRCVLTDEEKSQGYFFRHNMDALLRGDFKTRMEGYSTMLQNGVASVNEVRDLEDWDPVDGGDDHHIQLNMQSLPGGVPLTSQAAQLIKLGATQ